jgi:hypothetical protein
VIQREEGDKRGFVGEGPLMGVKNLGKDAVRNLGKV